MKVRKLLLTLASTLFLSAGTTALAQVPRINGGPGIAVAGSTNYDKLPKEAKSFIDRHFKGVGVKSCEQYFAKGKYEVELNNGIDLEFDRAGKLTEVDAPGNTLLSVEVVKDFLPRKAYDRLKKEGLDTKVESIEFKKGKAYEVDLSIPDPDTYIFDVNGVFLAIED